MTRLRTALLERLAPVDGRLVLAVSGGRDSMALLHAMARWAPERVAAVATYDHGTGPHATEAAALVVAEARRLGFAVVRERARTPISGEAAWRAARWEFLRRVAGGFRARVATAHTQDDQVETILMRWMRGSGARGLAGLAAPSSVVRPWLPVTRAELAAWGDSEGIPFVDDPSNADPRHLRVRLRLGLLPALVASSPGVGDDLLAIGERAAAWRRKVDAQLESAGLRTGPKGRWARLPAHVLEGATDEGRAVLWPALCAKAGVTLSAKGTAAAVRFTSRRRGGAWIPVAGGGVILRRVIAGEPCFEVRRSIGTARPSGELVEWQGPVDTLPRRVGGWRFVRLADGPVGAVPVMGGGGDPWIAALPSGSVVHVRGWRAGDRIRTTGAPAGRRVARYLSEAHVPAPDRPAWLVVVIDNEPVWVPGVCRGTAHPGAAPVPLLWYRCERESD
jgi:tRNA(Ile)-lysidine synthase